MNKLEDEDTEIDRCQDPITSDWYRIMLEWGTGCRWLERTTALALEFDARWMIVCDLGDQSDAKEAMETHLEFKAMRELTRGIR